jgi:hypothetical protein
MADTIKSQRKDITLNDFDDSKITEDVLLTKTDKEIQKILRVGTEE